MYVSLCRSPCMCVWERLINSIGSYCPRLRCYIFLANTCMYSQELIEEVLRTGNFPSKERIESVKREWSDEYKQKRDYERGVVYYLNGDKKVVGVLLWNVFGKLDSAQAIVERWRRFDDVSKLTRQISLDGFDIDEPLHK